MSYLPLVVLILGLVFFFLPSYPKLNQLGSIFVWVALAFVLAQAVIAGVDHLPRFR